MPRLIAFIDILGFKQLVHDLELSDLAARLNSIYNFASKENSWAISGFGTGEGQAKVTESRISKPNKLQFSDTILLWSELLPPTDSLLWNGEILTFTHQIRELIFHAFLVGLPLRVGLSCGEVLVEPTMGTILGTAIIDAYLTEQTQDWIGAAFHKSYPMMDGISYKVPIKDDTPVIPNATLGWFLRAATLDEEVGFNDQGRSYFELFCEAIKQYLNRCTSSSIRRKYINTFNFFEHYIAENTVILIMLFRIALIPKKSFRKD